MATSCAQKPFYLIKRESADPLTGLSFDSESKIRYRITSDEQFIYLRFDSERSDLALHFLHHGLNIFVDTTLKSNKAFTLTYPIADQQQLRLMPQPSGSRFADRKPRFRFKPELIWQSATQRLKINTDSVPMAGNFAVIQDTIASTISYKAAIPWHFLPTQGGFNDGRPFMIGLEITKPITRTMAGRGEQRGGGAPMSRGGNRGNMRPDNEMQEDGAREAKEPNKDQQQRDKTLSEPFILWLNVSTKPKL